LETNITAKLSRTPRTEAENKELTRLYNQKYRAANKEKLNAQSRVYRTKNKEKCQAAHDVWEEKNGASWRLNYKYGITLEQHNELLRVQGFTCAICKTDTPPNDKWNVDHDHMAGNVRGLLCTHCNWMLGHARDDTGILANAISYLQNPPANAVIH
jgi:hypothetical protein